jgi:AcrR family transcriptional regulator
MQANTPESRARHSSRVPFVIEMSTRVERTHTAVMEAATALLLEGGPNAVTIDGVVARSGVAKSTVYRHWTTRDELVADVFDHIAPKLNAPDPSLGFEDAVRALVHDTLAVMTAPGWQHALPALLLLKIHQSDIAKVEERMHEAQLQVWADVLHRGVAEGRISAADDDELLLALLIGPMLMAGLTGSVELNEAFANRLVDHFLAALGPAA